MHTAKLFTHVSQSNGGELFPMLVTVLTFPHAALGVAAVRQVSIFYTAPTAIRALLAKGDAFVTRHKLGSLRLLGSVGEPINPEAWRWYHEVVGGGRWGHQRISLSRGNTARRQVGGARG